MCTVEPLLSGHHSSRLKLGVLNSGVVKYTNVTFGAGESGIFMEVSLIQGCPHRGKFHCILIIIAHSLPTQC